ncbi:WhiB family transcriptional regulator [Streptomyces nanshensis]|uniref:4Fe-4S Wbl-type domain-containing protein n=1 Tax=Streptomyces nanshensis TaxID=518642 RepID=A0A1E7L2X3_9ACTN|nr:WhiB family transcriptional regulator [Streptomyces nanshensis]OEV10544.1 hypothetical protein AN218_16935 [Streptomyces nanshensis]
MTTKTRRIPPRLETSAVYKSPISSPVRAGRAVPKCVSRPELFGQGADLDEEEDDPAASSTEHANASGSDGAEPPPDELADLFQDYNADEAKAVCRMCPIAESCWAYALLSPTATQGGVWGGMTEPERDAMRGQLRDRLGDDWETKLATKVRLSARTDGTRLP